MDNSKKITWEALDHIKIEKSADWFWIVGIIVIGIVILLIFFNNLLLALLILIGTSTIFIQSNIEPEMKSYEINRKGFISGKSFYPFSSIESFWIVDEDGWDRDRILIKSKKLFMPLVTIPIGNEITPEEVRDFLSNYLKEEEIEEPALQLILNRLGF